MDDRRLYPRVVRRPWVVLETAVDNPRFEHVRLQHSDSSLQCGLVLCPFGGPLLSRTLTPTLLQRFLPIGIEQEDVSLKKRNIGQGNVASSQGRASTWSKASAQKLS